MKLTEANVSERAHRSVTWYSIGGVGAEARRVPEEGRVRAQGAELRLTPALKADAGRYACAVQAHDGAAVRQQVELQVRSESSIYLCRYRYRMNKAIPAILLFCCRSSEDITVHVFT